MKKLLWPTLALVALLGVGTNAYSAGGWYTGGTGGIGGGIGVTPPVTSLTNTYMPIAGSPWSTFGNTAYGAKISFDSFRYSVKKRMETMRTGTSGQPFGNPFSSVGRTGGPDNYYNRGGGYYNQNYNQNYAPPAGNYNPQWNPPPMPAPAGYNAPTNYDPYGGGNYGNYNQQNVNTNYYQSQPYSYNTDGFSSNNAYGMVPSSRSSYYSTSSRRALDCVYYSGFTVWADLYQTWAKQKSKGANEGYRYRTTGPAIGLDWTNGPLTFGAAMTYNWGKLKGRDSDIDHHMKLRTWAIDLYGQYNADNWYFNGSLGYAHNRYKSDRNSIGGSWNTTTEQYDLYAWPTHASFKSNSWNLDLEYGWKLNWKGFKVNPNVGLRYFHDKRKSFTETGENLWYHVNSKNYHVLEVPIGVDFAYEIASGGSLWIPRARVAWIPELARKSGGWTGSVTYWDHDGGSAGTGAWDTRTIAEGAAKRSRHGFLIGLGLEARISKSLSAHIDYNCNFRSGAYEHHWNLGAGFTF